MQLPPLTVAFHDDKQPCVGHPGYYRSCDIPRVDICGSLWDRSTTAAEKTILHELAHAWAGATLTEQTKDRCHRYPAVRTLNGTVQRDRITGDPVLAGIAGL